MKPGKRLARINIIAALSGGNIIAPLVRIGKTTAEVIENWIEKQLIPHLKAGQILILDNASFHRKQAITKLLEKVKCSARFLPTYSPDLNMIEHRWSGIKREIRKKWGIKSPEQSHLESAQNTLPLVC
jgi:transposase